MKTILVVNGESDWQEYLPGYTVVRKKIQSSEWVLRNDELHVVDAAGSCKPDKILWRVGAIRPSPKHKTALELIQLAGVPCVNNAAVLLQGYDRLSMLNVMKK